MHNTQAKLWPVTIHIAQIHSFCLYPLYLFAFCSIYVKVWKEQLIATKTYKYKLKSVWKENLGVDIREDGLASVSDIVHP